MIDPNHILGNPSYRREQLILESAWRFQLIAPLLDPRRSDADKAAFRRDLVSHKHPHPWRGEVSISARTARRWCQSYRSSRLSGLTLHERRDRGISRKLPEGALALAAELVAEDPGRAPTRLVTLLVGLRPDWQGKIKRSTLDRHMRALGLSVRDRGRNHNVYATFVAQAPDDLWQGDICHGPLVLVDGNEKVAKIVTWIDDHSRFILHIEAFPNEKLPAIEAALTRAILKHGIPLRILVDNGKVYSGKSFTLACSQLGIHKSHSAPYHPESKGKQERFYRTLRGQLLDEMDNIPPGPIETLNRFLLAWVERYHDTPHSQLNTPQGKPQTPRQRYQPTCYRPVTGELLDEAFLQWDMRKVSSQGKIEFAGQDYYVDPSLAHQRVIVRYDPFDLRRIWIWKDGKKLSQATPETLLRPSLPRKPKPDESKRSDATQRFLQSLEKSHKERLEREMNLIELSEQELEGE